MSTLAQLLDTPGITLPEITEHLDSLPHQYRIIQVVELKKRHQMKLWDLAANSGVALDMSYVVPENAKPLEFFPFEGKNSLPLFTRFQKVFYRLPDGGVAGYNNQNMAWFTGPGYYIANMSPYNPAEIEIDYTRVPNVKPAGWPAIKPNEGWYGIVYGGTKDYLRWVSDDVVIGRATKGGVEPMPNWFVLCRKEPRK